MPETRAWLLMDGWAGRTAAPVVVVGETPSRYRIRGVGTRPVRLAGHLRFVMPGDTALVPRYAVHFTFPKNATELPTDIEAPVDG